MTKIRKEQYVTDFFFKIISLIKGFLQYQIIAAAALYYHMNCIDAHNTDQYLSNVGISIK